MLALFPIFFLFFFRVVFWIVFWSFWGANMGRFWSPKSINMRLVSFWFLLFLYWFLNHFCILGGLMLVLYRFFFRIVFCIDFWSIWGSFCGSFWEALGGPNGLFLASILSWFWPQSWLYFGMLFDIFGNDFWSWFLTSTLGGILTENEPKNSWISRGWRQRGGLLSCQRQPKTSDLTRPAPCRRQGRRILRLRLWRRPPLQFQKLVNELAASRQAGMPCRQPGMLCWQPQPRLVNSNVVLAI